MPRPHVSAFSVIALSVALPAMLCLICARPAKADEAEARQLLASKGLAPTGRVWNLRAELEMRDRVEALDGLEKRLLLTQKALDALIEQNELARFKLAAADTLQKQLVDTAKAATTGRKQLEEAAKKQAEVVEQLKRLTIDPKKLAETASVRSAAVDYINARNELSLALIWLRPHAEALPVAYRTLANDSTVSAALAEINGATLPPLKNSYIDGKRLSTLESRTFNERVPVYREAGFYRCCALIDESIPATFSFRDSSDPVILPASMAQSLGLNLNSAETSVLQTTDKRKLQVQKVVIGSLRLGKYRWTNVEAVVLPPDAEDLGAQLSAHSLAGYRATIDANLLRLFIEPLK